MATETRQAAQSAGAPEAGATAEAADESKTPQWSGVHHMAMVTPDMDATVRFYDGVLGMRLCATLMAGPMRHYFFEIDEGNTIAFFEIKGIETFAKPAGGKPDRAIQFDHVSFALPDEAALLALRERLEAADCEVTTVVDHDIIRSIYFTDPNGIALEASWWVDDATSRRSNYNDPVLFTDPNPVPAVKELRKGRLRSTPSTKLV